MGGKPEVAYEYLKDVVLKTDDYPFSKRTENDAHIHTSIASSAVSTILDGKEDLENAMQIVHNHLDQSESKNPFDLHNRHVSANMYLKLARRYKDLDSNNYLICMADAVSVITTALSLASDNAKKTRSAYESYVMISNLQENLFQLTDSFDQNHELAIQLYQQKGLQIGFYALLKTLISEAEKLEKGKLFKRAENYLDDIELILQKQGDEFGSELIECRADLAIKWHLISGSTSSPDWKKLAEDLFLITDGVVNGKNVIWSFYLAVSLYHLEAITDAEAQFAQLRRLNIPSDIRRDRRCFYIDSQGIPINVQGEISAGVGESKWVYCPELNAQILCANDVRDNMKATIHFNVSFSFQGPLAIKRKG